MNKHDDVIKWKRFPRYWPFVRGIHRSPVNSTHKGQWRRALIVSLICVLINGWGNNRDAGDLRRHRAHYDVIVMKAIDTNITNHNKTWTLHKILVKKHKSRFYMQQTAWDIVPNCRESHKGALTKRIPFHIYIYIYIFPLMKLSNNPELDLVYTN